MPDAKPQPAFFSFMEEYTRFLEKMRGDEHERLEALRSKELPRIESTIATSQANTKQLANYEARRQEEQQRLGVADCTFRQLVDNAPPEQKGNLDQLYDRFERSVSDIRFFNNKSMAVARDSMKELDPSAVLPGQPGAGSNPYRSIREAQAERDSSILETKV